MCGIFAYLGEEINLGKLIFSSLKELEYRGYDSWGLVVQNNETISQHRAIGMLPEQFTENVSGQLGLGHTRWATTGKVNQNNAHPHTDCQSAVFVVHNGLIENHLELRTQVIANGHKLLSETDTEIIAHLLEERLESGFALLEAVQLVGQSLSGLNAFVVLARNSREIAAYKNGSPMYLCKTNDAWLIASDAYVLNSHSKEIVRVLDGETLAMTCRGLSLTNGEREFAFEERVEILALENKVASRNGNQSYLEMEISEQPQVIRQIAADNNESGQILRKFLNDGNFIWCSGCGSAYHAALFAESFFCADPKIRLRAAYAHEFHLWQDAVRKEDRVLLLSQSGETIDVLAVAKTLRLNLVPTAALLNVPGSSLQNEVALTLHLNAGRERCVLSTKAFAAKLALLYLAATENQKVARQQLHSAASAIEAALSPSLQSTSKTWARQLKHQQHLFVLGSGLLYPLALEAALKIKEVSYLHTEGVACGELKHGTLALFDNRTQCIVLVPNKHDDPLAYQRALIAAEEAQARGCCIYLLSAGAVSVASENKVVLGTEGLGTLFGMLTFIQSLSLHLALERNCHPDRPRNLAKSVTVK